MLRVGRHIFEPEFTILTFRLLCYLRYINISGQMFSRPGRKFQGRCTAIHLPTWPTGFICREIFNIPGAFQGLSQISGTEENITISRETMEHLRPLSITQIPRTG